MRCPDTGLREGSMSARPAKGLSDLANKFDLIRIGDWRMHFLLSLRPRHEQRFFQGKLRDLASSRIAQEFRLSFLLSSNTCE
jgi:hypothetical protein